MLDIIQKYYLKILLFVVVALSSQNVFALSVVMDPAYEVGVLTESGSFTTVNQAKHPDGFVDTFNFTVDTTSSVGTNVADFELTVGMQDIYSFDGDLTVTLYNEMGGELLVGPTLNTTLVDGDYFLTVAGIANGSSGGVYTAAFAAIVPIPAALLLFGSGLIGLIVVARRKRNIEETDKSSGSPSFA